MNLNFVKIFPSINHFWFHIPELGANRGLIFHPVVGKNLLCFLTKNVVEGIEGTFSSIAGQIRFATAKNFTKTHFFLVFI